MEEKILQLILSEIKDLKVNQEKVYREVTDIKEGQQRLEGRMDKLEEGQQRLEGRMDKLEEGQQRLEGRMDKLESKIETEITDKIRALYDFREVQADINNRIITTLDRIEAKVDVLQMETAQIRRVK
ncbi:hypothetical protein Tfer_2372 [Thermincola ferriacetica]|uniref:Uncharacterized protein n=1 Tax=Thermincola ferriacetica TaxID=281456 RepID=A0A0L6W0F8_9FIRM|nr:hypothetical protein [Thermincola ferriacetica]KNZ69010.1 hypothetical protein Tfer_2372 [Thermincola ferriacetica]